MKMFLLRQGLIPGSLYHVEIGIHKPKTFSEMLKKASKFIEFEDGLPSEEKKKSKHSDRPKERKEEHRSRDRRSPPPNKSRFHEFAPLNTSRANILEECLQAEFRDAGFQRPPRVKPYPGADKSKYCKWHRNVGHSTDDCWQLKDIVEQLVRQGKLQNYVKDKGRRNRQSVEEEEGRERPREGIPPVINVITGGPHFPVGSSIRSEKRKYKEISKIMAVERTHSSSRYDRKNRAPLAFYDEDLIGGRPNHEIPLIIKATMMGSEVRRILVDQGSSVDVIYKGLFERLNLKEGDLIPYKGKELQGFNGSRTVPMGHLSLPVTFGRSSKSKEVQVQFLVLPMEYDYNCIIGRPTIAELGAVTSTTHLKMRFHTVRGEVVTIQGDIDAARRCMEISLRRNSSEERKANDEEQPDKTGTEVAMIRAERDRVREGPVLRIYPEYV